LQLKPDCATTYFRQARALFATGQTDESIRSLQTAFRLDPQKREEFQRTYPELFRDARIRRHLGLDG
jgi:hypothetical protein